MQTMLLAPVIQLFDMYEGLEHQFDPEQYTECVRLSVDSCAALTEKKPVANATGQTFAV